MSFASRFAAFGDAFQARLSKTLGRPLFWAIAVPLLFVYPMTSGLTNRPPPPLPIIGQVPAFSLTDEWGQAFGSKELEGKIWVASFFFTRCPTVCPRINEKMAKIRHRGRGLAGGLHLVSISVDPEYDTPEKLNAYAKRFRQSSGTWTFLTGSAEAIRATVVEGLKISMGNDGPPGTYEGIFHGSHFVIVDAKGRMRAFVDANDEDAVDRVMRSISALTIPDAKNGAPVRANI